ILVPPTSMVHSAFGAVASDIHQASERSVLLRGGGAGREPWEGIDPTEFERVIAAIESKCRASLESSGIRADEVSVKRSVDMRFRRQTHSLIVPIPAGPIDELGLRALVEDFERRYDAKYGKGAGFREAGIETTTFRVEVVGRTQKPRLRVSDVR